MMQVKETHMTRLKDACLKRRNQGHIRLESTLFLDAYVDNLDKSLLLREALAVQNKFVHQELEIYDDEFLVGRASYEVFDCYYGSGVYIDYGDTRLNTDEHGTGLKKKLDIVREHTTSFMRSKNLSKEEQDPMDAGLVSANGWGGHMVVDFEKALSVGLRGIYQEIEARERFSTGIQPEFFKAMKCTAHAISTLITRYGEKALELQDNVCDDGREAELREIGKTCQWISRMPPRTFHEAVQLTWFIHLITGCDSFGRLDQYLWPFYNRDMEEQRLSREEAFDILKFLWLKILEAAWIQNLTLGGVTESGEDAVNDLTYLCMETSRYFRSPQPNLSLRLVPTSSPHLIEHALDTIELGMGVPALYNDEVIISGLQDLGMPLHTARGYCLAGCGQVVLPGQSHFGCDDGVYNAAKCLELVLNNGVDPVTGKQIGISTGDLETFVDFASLMSACKRQTKYAARVLGRACNMSDKAFGESCGYPIRTLLTRGCLETGKGIWEGGALHNAIQTECVGIPNVADSLVAIKRLVYEEKRISLSELVEILRKNWDGHDSLRLYCKNKVPKFGNDDDYVDAIYKEIAETVYSEVRGQPTRRGGMNIPGSVVFIYHTAYGSMTGATPDGRRAGEPLADSAGPSQRCDKHGPTAVVNSMLKFDHALGTTCVVLNLKFAKDGLVLEKLENLITSYFQQGGMQLQINVLDSDMLMMAQQRPDDFKSLTVRVGGFSAYFIELDKSLQDEIISRTFH